MKLEVLGSAGAVVTPKALCNCHVCLEARKYGPTYSRLGPSVYIHGPNILIDTPEDISTQLNRSNITKINACFYSHWHPDHTAGKRIFEFNMDWYNNPPNHKKTKIVLTESIYESFKTYMAISEHLTIFKSRGIIELEIIKDNQEIEINGYIIRPIQLSEKSFFGYEINNNLKKCLIIMDELKNWFPNNEMIKNQYDLIYLPFGIFDFNPLSKTRLIDKENPIILSEQTIGETLDIIKELNSKVFILSHIEEPDGISIRLAERLSDHYSNMINKNIQLAFDKLLIEI